jgi:GT2 family glycosyltransferase
MELSIIVTNYKNPQLLKVCLDSIRSNVNGIEYELIVVDGETQEDTEIMMREEYPDVVFFAFQENVGLQKLLKKGMEASSGKYLLILNGDIIVTPQSVNEMLSFIKSRPDVGMLGPKLLNFDGSLQYSCFRFYHPITIIYRRTFLGKLPFAKKHLDWFLMKDFDHNTTREVDWLMGSALMVSNEAIEKIGYTDPQFFMYMEDVDWCRRFWENGYKVIYYPKVEMHHYHGKGSAKGGAVRSLLLNRLTWVHISSGIKYFKKYWGKQTPKHD